MWWIYNDFINLHFSIYIVLDIFYIVYDFSKNSISKYRMQDIIVLYYLSIYPSIYLSIYLLGLGRCTMPSSIADGWQTCQCWVSIVIITPIFVQFLSQLYIWVVILCITCGHQGTATNMQGTETAFEWALLFYFWDSRSHGIYGAFTRYRTFLF